MAGAFETGKYRNVFAEYGYPEAEIQRRVEQTFETIFYGLLATDRIHKNKRSLKRSIHNADICL